MSTPQSNDTGFQVGDQVEVDISAGILPGATSEPDWQPGVIRRRTKEGLFRVELIRPIAGRPAEKDAAPEHIRRAGSA